MAWRSRRAGELAAALCILLQAGCGAAEERPSAADRQGGWHSLPRAPLSPRTTALGVWTGNEVLVVGGSDARPCPPTASCAVPDEAPLGDGAAFDPGTREWRRIADAPIPFEWADAVVIGETAYVWVPGTPGRPKAERAFLAYRIDADLWEELPLPPEAAHFALARAGTQLVLYSHTDENGELPDYVFDPGARSWSELPRDPLSPSFDRTMAWSGRELVLFDHELVANPGSERPALTRAAALDLETRAWRRLPDSEMIATAPWVATEDGRLINPSLGGADGGDVGNWGRTYPFGGILDVTRGRWSALPALPRGAGAFSAGVLTTTGAAYFAPAGAVLDAATGRWLDVPQLDADTLVTGRTVTAAGSDLLVFGGARWKSPDSLEAELLDTAFIWRHERAR